MTVRVKVCGVTRVEDAQAAVQLGADLVGLNFYTPSPRCITMERAREIHDAIGGRAKLVGVFVNAAREYVEERVDGLKLDLIQFHGDEDENELGGWPVPVIRAFRLRAGDRPDALTATRAEFVLLDTLDPKLYGGTGHARGLAGLSGYDLSRAFISGGLTAKNVAEAAALRPYAVDVASGVESAPGIKDSAKLASFIRNAKSA
ncbi:MAG: phosphoribosylanthranilate isomerase [Candidatus Binataceae bacterium]